MGRRERWDGDQAATSGSVQLGLPSGTCSDSVKARGRLLAEDPTPLNRLSLLGKGRAQESVRIAPRLNAHFSQGLSLAFNISRFVPGIQQPAAGCSPEHFAHVRGCHER